MDQAKEIADLLSQWSHHITRKSFIGSALLETFGSDYGEVVFEETSLEALLTPVFDLYEGLAEELGKVSQIEWEALKTILEIYDGYNKPFIAPRKCEEAIVGFNDLNGEELDPMLFCNKFSSYWDGKFWYVDYTTDAFIDEFLVGQYWYQAEP